MVLGLDGLDHAHQQYILPGCVRGQSWTWVGAAVRMPFRHRWERKSVGCHGGAAVSQWRLVRLHVCDGMEGQKGAGVKG